MTGVNCPWEFYLGCRQFTRQGLTGYLIPALERNETIRRGEVAPLLYMARLAYLQVPYDRKPMHTREQLLTANTYYTKE